jgi:hypothetical protein
VLQSLYFCPWNSYSSKVFCKIHFFLQTWKKIFRLFILLRADSSSILRDILNLISPPYPWWQKGDGILLAWLTLSSTFFNKRIKITKYGRCAFSQTNIYSFRFLYHKLVLKQRTVLQHDKNCKIIIWKTK